MNSIHAKLAQKPLGQLEQREMLGVRYANFSLSQNFFIASIIVFGWKSLRDS
jgi:hypothetical protein